MIKRFIVLFVVCLIPVLLCQGNEEVYATFDSGTVTKADLRGYIDANSRVFPATGTLVDYRSSYNDKDYVEKILADIAFGKIASEYVDEEDLRKDPFEWSTYKEMKRKVAYRYLQLAESLPRIQQGRKDYEQRVRDFYNENRESRFTLPAEVTFQIIFFNLKDVDDEDVIEEKRKKSEEVAGILEKEPGRFDSLAEQYSEADFKEGKLKAIGPYKSKQLDDALESALEKVEVGDITPAVKTKNGFIIARLVDRKTAYKPLEEAREEIVKEIGGFSGLPFESTFFVALGGRAEPEVYFDKITSAPVSRDVVVAEGQDLTLTNGDILFLYNADQDFNAILKEKPAEELVAKQYVGPVFREETVALSAKKRGMLNTPRYTRMEQVSRNMFLRKYLIKQFRNEELPKEIADPDKVKDIQKYLLEKHEFEIKKVPGIDELFD